MTGGSELGSHADLDDIGPIDYIVVEWPGRQPDGAALGFLVDLVDRGIIRILDLAVMAKDPDGTYGAIDLAELEAESGLGAFAGASSGLLAQDDLDDAASVLEPGSAAAVLLWENRWAAPFASAVRHSGGQLVASGRIPVQALAASLDAAEAESTATS